MTVGLQDGPLDEIGGKAWGLARLMDLGLPVPPAVVVPVSDRGVLKDPADIARLLGEPLAVRSSAVGEDASDRSAAGQYESLMGVRASNLAAAVQEVWRSSESERVRAYRGNGGAGMAVVIQREVAATRAGVAFSRDPIGTREEAVVECVFGHGEQLVSGQANPDRFWVRGDGSVQARLAVREGKHRLLRTLRDDEARAVAGVARQAEHGLGYAVDIEFCFEGPKLWLVQCRSITSLG